MAVPFSVSVTPAVNQVYVGDTATFECIVNGGVQIAAYEWVGYEKIALEERFKYEDMMRILHIEDVKSYDNNTMVDCTATAIGGGQRTNSSKLVALLNADIGGLEESLNGTVGEFDEIPPITVGGGVLLGFCYILVIIAMIGVLWWLKRSEIQKQRDVEASRNRYSRMINSRTAPTPTSTAQQPRAQYNRGDDQVLLNGQHDWDAQDSGEVSDSYEDMIPSPVALVPPKGPSYGSSPGRSAGAQPLHLPLGGSPRNMQPRASPSVQPRGSPAVQPRSSPAVQPRASPANYRYPQRT